MAGPAGAQGSIGPNGVVGPTGPQGLPGPPGTVSGLPVQVATEVAGKAVVATTAQVWGAHHIVTPTPATVSGYVTRVRIAVAAAQKIRVFVVTLNGDGTLTQVATTGDLNIAAGVNDLPLGLPIAAGQYIGFKTSIGPHHTLGAGTFAYWYTSFSTPITTNTPKLLTAATGGSSTVVEVGFEIEGEALGAAHVGQRLAPGLVRDVISGINGATEPAQVGALASSTVVVLPTPSLVTGFVSQVSLSSAALQTGKLLILNHNTDGTLTLVSEHDLALSVGGNVMLLIEAVPIAAGQHVGYRVAASSSYVVSSGGLSPSHWGVAAALTVGGGPVAKNIGNGAQFQFKVRINGSTVAESHRTVALSLPRGGGSPWAGLSWAALGTSITAQGLYTTPLASGIGATLTNLGVGGARIAAMITDQIPLIPTNAKLVTFEAGINDFPDGPVLGAVGDTTTATFCGALYVAITNIKARSPNALIVLLTPFSADSRAPTRTPTSVNAQGNTLRQFQQAIVDVAGWQGVPVVDVGRRSGQGAINATTFTTDGLHHSAAGGTHYADFVAKKLWALRYP